MELRPPLTALLIAPGDDARRAIQSGRRSISIRQGHRDYRPGQTVMLCCHIDPWCLMTDLTEVRHTRLGEVTEAELADDGFLDHEDMLASLRTFYPDLTPASPVTVIRWGEVRGKLAGQE